MSGSYTNTVKATKGYICYIHLIADGMTILLPLANVVLSFLSIKNTSQPRENTEQIFYQAKMNI